MKAGTYTMSSNYNYQTTSLTDCYATTHTNLSDSLCFNLATYNFSDVNTSVFVKGGTTTLNGWGITAACPGYKYNNADIKFCTKESCPVPGYYTSGDHYLALKGNFYTTSKQIRYNSSKGYCELADKDSSSWSKIGSGFSGLFLGLQGGGGGGSSGEFSNIGVGAWSKGGGGGGAGAFIFCYVNFSAIPDTIVTINVGGGGDGGLAPPALSNARPGTWGSGTTLVVGGKTYLTAGGGRGGYGGGGDGRIPGGDGGESSLTCDLSYVTILNSYYGKKGGSGGESANYVVGIPNGPKYGTAGGSFISSDCLNVPIFKSSISVPVLRYWASDYPSGAGAPDYNSDGGAYSSGGGGGGASVCGQYSTSNASTTYGYGIGGAGGTATTGSAKAGYAGKTGCLFIASCSKI